MLPLLPLLCATYYLCISEINNTQVYNAKDIDAVMPTYNLIEYKDTWPKTSGSLWQYCRNKPSVNDNGVIIAFNAAKVTDSSSFKEKVIGQTDDNGTKVVETTARYIA